MRLVVYGASVPAVTTLKVSRSGSTSGGLGRDLSAAWLLDTIIDVQTSRRPGHCGPGRVSAAGRRGPAHPRHAPRLGWLHRLLGL